MTVFESVHLDTRKLGPYKCIQMLCIYIYIYVCVGVCVCVCLYNIYIYMSVCVCVCLFTCALIYCVVLTSGCFASRIPGELLPADPRSHSDEALKGDGR